MKIAIQNPEFCFAFFYVLSFAISFILFIVFTSRLKIPLRSVLIILTTVSLCVIIGSRLSAIPVSEWGNIIVSGTFEGYQDRYAVGGLLFGLAGLILCRKILGSGITIINLYAWITPVGLGIQKIGCFLNGCCYGKPSDLPWSVQYPRCTNAHYHHWINGLIDENDLFSLGVHPVQLYEAFLFFLIAFVVRRSLKFWKREWSPLIFSLCLLATFRFLMEFLRDTPVLSGSFTILPGINPVQWFLLVMAIVCLLGLILPERSSKPVSGNLPEAQPSLRFLILYVISLSAVIYVFRNLFTSFELISLNIRFIPAILLTGHFVFRSLKTVSFRLTATASIIFPLLLVTQTFSPDSTKSKSVKEFYSEVKSYRRVDLNTSFGEHYNTVQYNPHESYCGTGYTNEDYKHLYRITGGGYSIIRNEGKYITTRGINLYGGINKENNLTKHWERTDFLFGVKPYFKYDLKWVGLGVGAHLGNIRWVPGSPIDKLNYDRGTRSSPVMPAVLLRVGRADILNFQYNYGFNYPASIPVLLHEFSIGAGFGFKDGYDLRFGAAVSENYSATFISAEALVAKNFGLALKYNFGGEDFYYYTSDNPDYKYIDRKGRILFGLNYRFGFEK